MWNGYRNESQHGGLTAEKEILHLLLAGIEPATFRSRIRRRIAELYPRYQMSVEVWVTVISFIAACGSSLAVETEFTLSPW